MRRRALWTVGLLAGAAASHLLGRAPAVAPLGIVLSWCVLVLAAGATASRWVDLRIPASTPSLGWLDRWVEWTGLGMATVSVWLTLADALGVPLGAATLSLLLVVALLGPPRGSGPRPDPRGGWGRITLALLVLGLLLAAAAAFVPPTGTDAPAHLDGIRQVRLTGEPFPHMGPTDGMAGAKPDPRFGTWHAMVAAVWWWAGGDLQTVWALLALVLAVPVLLAVERVGRSLLGSFAGGALSLAAYLILMGRMEGDLLTMTALPAVATRTLFGLLLVRILRWGRERPGRAGVGAAAFLAAGLSMLRLDYYSMVTAVLGILLLLEVFRPRARSRWSLLPLVLAWIAGAAPFLAYKYLLSFPVPEGYLEGQRVGALLLGGGWRMANPFRLGPDVLLLLALTTLAFARWWRRIPGSSARLLLALLLAGSLAYNPLFYRLAEPILSGPYVQRLGKLLPLYWLTALALSLPLLARREGVRRREALVLAACALALVAIAARPFLRGLDPRRALERHARAEEVFPESVRHWMLERGGAEVMVLASPKLGYVIAGATGCGVVSVPPTHASPLVADARQRRRDALRWLSGCLSPKEAEEILARYDVDWVVRKRRGHEAPHAGLLFEDGPWLVLEAGTSALPPAQGCGVPRDVTERRAWREPMPGLHLALSLPDTLTARRGQRLRLPVAWRSDRPLDLDPVWVLRFDEDFPRGPLYDPAWGKPYRKLREILSGARYRFRAMAAPCRRNPPVFAWEPSLVYADTLRVPVPRDIHPGLFRVKFKMLQLEARPTWTLTDYLRDDDRMNGEAIGWLRVEE